MSRVLELGCSTGATGALLKEQPGVEVVGVEFDPGYAAKAARVLDQVVVHDLNDPAWLEDVDGSFDCIVAADVLEHLVDPWTVLRRAVDRLTRDGHVVLSIPNVRHVHSLLGLAFGRWPYRERGTHDSTHLRFFTLREIRGLCAAAGLVVADVTRSYRFFDRPSPVDRFARLAGISPFRELLTYQYLVRAVRAHGALPSLGERVPPWARRP